MKDIKKPEFMLEAMRGRRGFIAVLEILIAIVVFVTRMKQESNSVEWRDVHRSISRSLQKAERLNR